MGEYPSSAMQDPSTRGLIYGLADAIIEVAKQSNVVKDFDNGLAELVDVFEEKADKRTARSSELASSYTSRAHILKLIRERIRRGRYLR